MCPTTFFNSHLTFCLINFNNETFIRVTPNKSHTLKFCENCEQLIDPVDIGFKFFSGGVMK